jgi:hypothetical protein
MLQTPNHQLEGHSPYVEDFARATNNVAHLRTQAPTISLTSTKKNRHVTMQFVTYHSREFIYAYLIHLQKEPANSPSHP